MAGGQAVEPVGAVGTGQRRLQQGRAGGVVDVDPHAGEAGLAGILNAVAIIGRGSGPAVVPDPIANAARGAGGQGETSVHVGQRLTDGEWDSGGQAGARISVAILGVVAAGVLRTERVASGRSELQDIVARRQTREFIEAVGVADPRG